MLVSSRDKTTCLPAPFLTDGQHGNRKADLKNDLLAFLRQNNLGWRADSVSECAPKLLNAVADALWYVDGNHDTLANRHLPIPAMFQQFAGYNQLEMRKKRKRDSSSLKEGAMDALSTSLFSLAGGV